MADSGVPILLDLVGNDKYAQTSREFLTSPILTDYVRVLLTTADQINNVIRIRNEKSFGSESNRDISLQKYISATDRTNLIIDIPISPPILLDGQTFFETDIEPQSEIDLLFFFDQKDIGDKLK
jgi:hypothetical protein